MPTLYLIRHGQASFGKANYDQLSQIGYQQAAALAGIVKIKADYLYRGTMLRHQQTAEGYVAAAGLNQPLQVLPSLNEYDFQDILTRLPPPARLSTLAAPKAMQAYFEAAIDRWQAGQHDDYQESWAAFKARCLHAIDTMASGLNKGEVALAFTSGGLIGTVAAHLLGLPDREAMRLNWRIANASISKIALGKERRQLISFNEHHAFEGGALLTYR
jgi:broad specificity phosphatase PhoE